MVEDAPPPMIFRRTKAAVNAVAVPYAYETPYSVFQYPRHVGTIHARAIVCQAGRTVDAAAVTAVVTVFVVVVAAAAVPQNAWRSVGGLWRLERERRVV